MLIVYKRQRAPHRASVVNNLQDGERAIVVAMVVMMTLGCETCDENLRVNRILCYSAKMMLKCAPICYLWTAFKLTLIFSAVNMISKVLSSKKNKNKKASTVSLLRV